MLNILDTTLDYYQEIFRFVLQANEYQQYLYLQKKLLRPYRPDTPPMPAPEGEAALKEDGMTLVRLIKQVKIGFQLQEVYDWDQDLEPLDIFFLLRGPQAAITIPVADPRQLTSEGLLQLDLERYRHFVVALSPDSPKKELFWNISLKLRHYLQPLKKGRPQKTAPTSVDTDTRDPAVPAREIVPTVAMPVTDPCTLFSCTPEALQRMNMDRHHYFMIGIDPTCPKKQVLQDIDLALRPHLEPLNRRRPKAVKIPRGEAFRLARLKKTFRQIGESYETASTAAHKAFMRDFTDVYGKEYKPGFTSRKAVPLHQLRKTCATCADKVGCTALCPEMDAFVNQDYGSLKELPVDPQQSEGLAKSNNESPPEYPTPDQF